MPSPHLHQDAVRLLGSDQRLYLLIQGRNRAVGLLKVGTKKLFVAVEPSRSSQSSRFQRSSQSQTVQEISPLCVLDFYVHESVQRQGVGRKLFDYMLSVERKSPARLAYDRPSPKLISFLGKHFGLRKYEDFLDRSIDFSSVLRGGSHFLLRKNSNKRELSRTTSRTSSSSPSLSYTPQSNKFIIYHKYFHEHDPTSFPPASCPLELDPGINEVGSGGRRGPTENSGAEDSGAGAGRGSQKKNPEAFPEERTGAADGGSSPPGATKLMNRSVRFADVDVISSSSRPSSKGGDALDALTTQQERLHSEKTRSRGLTGGGGGGGEFPHRSTKQQMDEEVRAFPHRSTKQQMDEEVRGEDAITPAWEWNSCGRDRMHVWSREGGLWSYVHFYCSGGCELSCGHS